MKNETLLLIILIPGFPENEADSACLPAQQSFVSAVNRFFPSVQVLLLSFHYPYSAGRYSWMGNEVIAFGGHNRGGLSRWLLHQKIKQTLAHVAKERKPIGLLSFWCGECALLGHRFAIRNNIPHYAWIMGQDARKTNSFVRKMRPRAEELIAISDFVRREFHRHHTVMPAQVIPIGIMPDDFPVEQPPRDIDILCVGSLIPLKQFQQAIEVIAGVKDYFPNIRALIVGKGPEQKRLQRAIDQAKLSSSVLLTGELPHAEALQLMKRSTILLHPSSYEGFSGVCLEALYAGARVVSFCKPMEASIDGWHVTYTQEEMITRTVMLLSEAAPARSSLPFPIETTAKEVLGLFGQ